MKIPSKFLAICAFFASLSVPVFGAPPETGKVIDAYLNVQTALAKDDLAGAQKGAKELEAVSAEGDAKEIHAAAKEVVGAANIDAARKAFGALSNKTIAFAKNHKAGLEKEVYVAHCPMALQGGADWLQSTKKVANPYFGASMLGCGSVKETISK
jgi:hypothetical protein